MTTQSFSLNEMITRQTLSNLIDKRMDMDISAEHEICVLMTKNNITELTLHQPIPMVLKGKIKGITDIKITKPFGDDYFELAYRFEDTKDYIFADDMKEDTNLFHIPYMELFIAVANTFYPNILD